jgi:heme/copper-type cytochrome/quinol oxidase subunit 2
MKTTPFLQRGAARRIALLFLTLLSGQKVLLGAETVTLPVAVSTVGRGGVPFVSDVRVFNTSYTDVVNVTAIFRSGNVQRTFQLAPREAKAFDDICAGFFGATGSLSAIDFLHDGPPGALAVTSQLRSPAAGGGHVGTFVPGLPQSAAQPVTVVTSLVNGEARTNIGVYNPNDAPVTAAIRLFDGPVLLGTVPVSLGARAVNQYNDIYRTVGFETLQRADGYATVESADGRTALFSYAAEADNVSGDLILVVGSADVAAPAGFHPPTPSPTATAMTLSPTPTPTPTAPPATTVVNLVATDFQWNFDGAGNSFVMHVGQTYELHIRSGDPLGRAAHGFGGIPALGLGGQVLPAGSSPGIVSFTPTAAQIGAFAFACNMPSCGSGHSNMIGTIQIVR